MTWLNLTMEERATIEDVQTTSSDRAAVIVAAALLEERLGDAIRSKMQREKTTLAHLFRSSGPLGSFSAKIDLGFLMGLYSKESHADLNAIKNIRNEFAHNLRTRDFRSQRVRDLCTNIKIADQNFTFTPDDKKLKPIKVFKELDPDSPSYLRDKYVRACQVFVAIFAVYIRKRKPREPYF